MNFMPFAVPIAIALSVIATSRDVSPAETAPGEGTLLVANKGDQTLGIIDPETGRQIATVREDGFTGHEIAASPDGRVAFVPIYGNSGVGLPGTDGASLDLIDIASRKIVGKIDFSHGVRPHCAVFGPKDGLLYVTTEIDNAISVIDPRSLKIVGSIPTGQPQSHMLAISADGKRGYTTNVGSGTISVLDMENRKVITTVPIAGEIQRISLSKDGKLAFTSDQGKPRLAVVETASNKVKTWIPLPGLGYGTAPTPDGRWLVVAMRPASKVGVVDLSAMKVAHVIDVPAAPQEVLIRPDGQVAYVSCDASHKVVAIRTADWAVEKLIDAGPGADGLAWAVRR